MADLAVFDVDEAAVAADQVAINPNNAPVSDPMAVDHIHADVIFLNADTTFLNGDMNFLNANITLLSEDNNFPPPIVEPPAFPDPPLRRPLRYCVSFLFFI